MKKAIRKAIMKMSAVENKYVKTKTKKNLKPCQKQRNNERKLYYERLD